MKKTDKNLLLVLRLFTATPFDVLVFYFLLWSRWLVSLCSRTRYAGISLAIYLDYLQLFGLLCLTLSDHIIMSFISLG